MDFCLFGDDAFARTYGANRNALLLAAPGELIVTTDDDTVSQPVLFGGQEKSLEITSQNDPSLFRFHADRGELVARVNAAGVDIISAHEHLLGRSIAGCAAALGPGCTLELGRLGPESAYKLCRTPAVVSATMSGIWGDSGIGSPNLALELQGESRDLLVRSHAEYRRAINSREICRSVPRYTISDGALFITTNAGLDNRALLPPFLPVGRNEDGVFVMTLHVCAQDALIGHLPLAIHHAPDEERRWPSDAFLDPTPRLADIIAAIFASFTPFPGLRDLAQGLSGMGKHFVDLGTLKMDDFEEQIRTIWLATMSRHIGFLDYLLDLHHGQPDFWAKDVLTRIENFKDFVVHGSPAVLSELHENQPVEQAKESCKRLVRKFGELLHWWPVIYGAAKKLRDADKRLVRRA